MKRKKIGVAVLAILLTSLNVAFAETKYGYYDAPYFRYEAEQATRGGAAVLHGPSIDQSKLEAQASNTQYVALPSAGSSVEWTIREGEGGSGVTLRFTMPDEPDGWNFDHWNIPARWKREDVFVGSLDVYVNGEKQTIDQYGKTSNSIPLSSFWMWQYFNYGNPIDVPGQTTETGRFAFDEVHFILKNLELKSGDVIKIQNNDGKYEYGVDFIEIEHVPAVIEQPENSISVGDYGNNRAAIDACYAACKTNNKDMYFPPGVYEYYSAQEYKNIWYLSSTTGIKITGAGMWHTNLHFPSSRPSGGGVGGENTGVQSNNVEFCNMYLSSMLRSRHYQEAVYKAFMEGWGKECYFHDLWMEHFECGFWIGDYNAPFIGTEDLLIEYCRIRNNLADGVNFCVGTINSTVRHCNVRGNGDDGLAMWNNDGHAGRDQTDNVFSYNTVENNWRAGGIAIFGGEGHQILNNYIKDCYKGSGIRLSTTFPGYKFNKNERGILFKDNIIINCGTSWDCYGMKGKDPSERGAIDLAAAESGIKNITFENTQICNSHRCAIQFCELGKFENIVFKNTTVNKVNLDGGTDSKFTGPQLGVGRVVYASPCSGDVTFEGLTVRNVPQSQLEYINPKEFKVTYATTTVFEEFTEEDCVCKQQNDPTNTIEIPRDYIDGKSIVSYGNTVEIDGLVSGEIVSVYNILGAKIFTLKAGQEKEYITSLKNGIYTVVIDGTRVAKKVFVVR